MSNSHLRAIDILRLLRRSRTPLSLSTISSELKIPLSTTLAILRSLVDREAVAIGSDKSYRIGPAVFYIGSSYATASPLYRVAWNDLVQLADQFQLSATLAVPWDQHHLMLSVHSNTGIPNLPPGSRIPISAGAYGKAYFAWSGACLPSSLPSFTASTIVDPSRYAEEIDRARHDGYATDNEELLEGAAVVAVGVTGGSGYTGTLALWSRPAERLVEVISFAAAGRQLSELAGQASVVLGDPKRDQPWHEDH